MDAEDEKCFRESLAGDSDSLPLASDFAEELVPSAEPLSLEPPPDSGEPFWRGEADGPMPMRRQIFGRSLPALSRIDPGSWRAVLSALSGPERLTAALDPTLTTAGRNISYDLATTLPESASERARGALLHGTRLPMPTVTAAASRSGHQVNVRIPAENYERLQVAAALLGLKPTQVARMLINNGVHRVLADHDAEIDPARGP